MLEGSFSSAYSHFLHGDPLVTVTTAPFFIVRTSGLVDVDTGLRHGLKPPLTTTVLPVCIGVVARGLSCFVARRCAWFVAAVPLTFAIAAATMAEGLPLESNSPHASCSVCLAEDVVERERCARRSTLHVAVLLLMRCIPGLFLL